MNVERGLLIHPAELGEKWLGRVCSSTLKRFGLHPVGGGKANESMAGLIADIGTLTPALDRIESCGIAVEHEMHALRWMLPAEMFAAHPDWFRMNEKGERTADYNLCVSNRDALDYVTVRAAEAARLLPAKSHRYHFWIDDVRKAHCSCPDCRGLSPSDQALRIYNAILVGLRLTDPEAKQCYLSYHDTLEAPRKVEPAEGIYLEYAPMDRDFDRPLSDAESEKNRDQTSVLPALLSCFGKTDAMACEYWLDNSMYSRWTKPPKYFEWNRDVTVQDLEFYDRWGFSAATTFACYLGPDYEETHGSFPEIGEYLTM